uniref:Chromosome segregation ATPase n=1 Tax=Iridovirus LCIVAC01 TaxID=2506607 RepID=A0A481YQU7_9VIRU|nr:MAG: chromosome segregation ATPase [Iridovirus LCIVAC01]
MKIKLKNFKCWKSNEFIFPDKGLVLLSGASGVGKCLGKDTPILMYNGTIKLVQNIKIGDQIMGDDSTPRNVLCISSGEDTLYEIIPTKGRSYIINSKHILTLKGDTPRKYYRKDRNKWAVSWMKNCFHNKKSFNNEKDATEFLKALPSEPISDISIEDYLKLSKTSQRYNYTFHTGINFKEQDIPLDPYFLGVWLGDGTSSASAITTADELLLEKIKIILEKEDMILKGPYGYNYNIVNSPTSLSPPVKSTTGIYGLSFVEKRNVWQCQWKENDKLKSRYFSVAKYGLKESKEMAEKFILSKNIKPKKRQNPITNKLKFINVWKNKHIPLLYKVNSRKNRLSLLAGLIDTDGYVSNNTIEIVQKSKRLAKDIEYLAFSLGFMVTFKEVEKICTNSKNPKKGKYFLVKIFGNNLDEIPTILPRKKLNKRKQIKRATVQGFKVKNIGIGRYYGFQLDGNNNRFLLADFTVTHNSSILQALYFALYGSGRNLRSYNSSSCQVSMEFDDMDIIRTKRPNRVVLNGTYEDQVAQNIINKKFGNKFDVTSFIQQNIRTPFILMGPMEKLSFLEDLTFQNTDLKEIKLRSKELTSKRKEELIAIQSKIELAKAVFEEMDKPEKVRFPVKCDKSEREKVIEKIIKNCDKCENLIEKLNEKYNLFRMILSDTRILNEYIQTKNIQIQQIKDKIIKSEQEIVLLRDNFGNTIEESIKYFEEKLRKCLSSKKLNRLRNQYETDKTRYECLIKEDKNRNKTRIEELDTILWKEHSEDECKNSIMEYRELLQDKKQYEEYMNQISQVALNDEENTTKNDRLDEVEEEIKNQNILLQKQLICPTCNESLTLHEGRLILQNSTCDMDEITDKINKLTLEKNELKNYCSQQEAKKREKEFLNRRVSKILSNYDKDFLEVSIEAILLDIEYIEYYYNEQRSLSKERRKLIKKDSKNKPILLKLARDLENNKEEILVLENELDNSQAEKLNENQIREDIKRYEYAQEKKKTLDNRLFSLEQELQTCEDDIKTREDNFLSRHRKIYSIEDIKARQEQISEKLENIRKRKSNFIIKLDKIEKWREYTKAQKTYNEWENKIFNLENEEKESEKKLSASMILKEKIAEAEAIAISRNIFSINTHALIYLEQFFEDPISVRLVPFKESKKGRKPQVHLIVDYKGMECDISSLSGGELDRVILAFTLALAEMDNSPIVMLDECISSLDQGLANTVLQILRENYRDKLVIVVAHQIVKGLFDKVIEL